VAQEVSQMRLSSNGAVGQRPVLYFIVALQFLGGGISGGGELLGAPICGELGCRLCPQ
jgi:hypothetical protein